MRTTPATWWSPSNSLHQNGTSLNSTANNTNYITHSQGFEGFDIRALFICLAVLGVIIIIANGLVFSLVYLRRKLLKKSNYFLISLALSDMLTAAVGIPLIVTCSTTGNQLTCTAMDVSNKFLAISTIMHLLSATVERYVKVLAPFRYRTLVTNQRVVLILAGIWVFSVAAPLIEFTWPEKFGNITVIYSLVLLSVFVVFPFLFMNFVSFHIFYIIGKQKTRLKTLSNRKLVKKKQNRKQAERRAIAVYSAMSVSFAIGWFPYFYLAYVSDFIQGYVKIHPILNSFLLFLKFSTALVNPLLYTFFKKDFQLALKSCMQPRRQGNISRTSLRMTTMQSIASHESSSDEGERRHSQDVGTDAGVLVQ